MKILAGLFFLLTLGTMALITFGLLGKATYPLDLGVEYRVVDFISKKEVVLEWSSGGHREGGVESEITLTNGQLVRVQALMRPGFLGIRPARAIKFIARPAP